MWSRRNRSLYLALVVCVVMLLLTLMASADGSRQLFLPIVRESGPAMEEVRGLWITRFDWTNYSSADPAKIDEIVDQSAAARFNVLFFQVRGVADAYYTPGLEPWARRLSGALGQDPGWDPLARLVQRAHQRGIQVHAYLNVYPVWQGCEAPPDGTQPRHLYYQLQEAHGETDGKHNGLQWDSDENVICNVYQRASPASIDFDTHFLAVATDLVQRYDIDGLHLDHIRYAGRNSSCDPVSEGRFEGECFLADGYEDWQRQQVNGTVRKLYEEVLSLKPGLWLTATAWPVYRDIWGWGASSGFDSYYQDPKAWMAGEYIDGVTPMIYRDRPDCAEPYFWTMDRWRTSMKDYLSGSNGRHIIGGIGTSFCTGNDFAEIEARINEARSLGTAGHAIFSYKSLLEKGYFDDLAQGPHRIRAIVPDVPWHP